ncbi:hypothetical protein AGR6A_pAt30017 [Agrobacterium sp. NCPPB 925]|nr:hypothetical protein AGR6A_pAt30017 [Agrobacterium sp. NCPPB 925]
MLIGRDAWVCVLPASHRLGRRDALSLAEFVAEPFVLATGGCHVNARTLATAAGLSLADVRMEVRDWASAIALLREGVGVSLVPESTLPERRRGVRTVRPDFEEHMASLIPAGRMGRPEELARAALFLASDAGSFVNGIELHVNGGMTLI